MSLLSRWRLRDKDLSATHSASAEDTSRSAPFEESILGDRGIPSINRARSIQSRVSSVLALSLISALALGLLTWYYAHTLTRGGHVQQSAQAALKNRAQGETPLPSLGPIEAPFLKRIGFFPRNYGRGKAFGPSTRIAGHSATDAGALRCARACEC